MALATHLRGAGRQHGVAPNAKTPAQGDRCSVLLVAGSGSHACRRIPVSPVLGVRAVWHAGRAVSSSVARARWSLGPVFLPQRSRSLSLALAALVDDGVSAWTTPSSLRPFPCTSAHHRQAGGTTSAGHGQVRMGSAGAGTVWRSATFARAAHPCRRAARL